MEAMAGPRHALPALAGTGMTALVSAERLTRHFDAGGFRRAPPVQAVTEVTLAIDRGESGSAGG